MISLGIAVGTAAVIYIYVVHIAGVSDVKGQITTGALIALVLALGDRDLLRDRWRPSGSGSIQDAAHKVAEGDFGARIPVDSSGQLGQLARTFNEMQRRLAELDNARKQFIANASHELRTPIFSLGGFVELLEEDEPTPEEREEFVRTMRQQIDRLTKLTADLLNLSQLDAGGIVMAPSSVDLTDLARSVDPRVRAPRRPARLAARAAHARPRR